MKKIIISDSTLKTASKGLSFREKTAVAKALDAMGVDTVELYTPAKSHEDAVVISTICSAVKNTAIAIPCSMNNDDIDHALECIKNNGIIQFEVPVSTVCMEYTYHMKSPKMLEAVKKALSYAAEKGAKTEVVCMDASRAEEGFVAEVAKTAKECGAAALTLQDDAGIFLPEELAACVETVKSVADIAVYVAPSNEMGMALACAAAAIKAGADGVKTSVAEGLALDGVAQFMKLKGDAMGIGAKLDLTKCAHAVADLRARVFDGAKAAPLVPKEDAENISLSADAGLPEVGEAVVALGYELSADDMGKVYEEFLRVAKRRSVIGAKELEAIIASSAMQAPSTYHVESYISTSGNIAPSMCNITLIKEGEKLAGVASGDGPIDAAFKAIEQIIGHHYELDDFKITAVTEGKEAVGSAIVRLRDDGKLYSGNGISTDIIGAGIRAYINALNKIVYGEN